MSIKNSNDAIGNRTRDLPTFSAVPQPNAPPRAPLLISLHVVNFIFCVLLSAAFNLYTSLRMGSQFQPHAKQQAKFSVNPYVFIGGGRKEF